MTNISTFGAPPRGSLRAFWLDGLLTSITDSLVVSYISLYALALGATGTQIGWLTAGAGILGTAMLLPGARIAERWGKRKHLVTLTYTLARLMLLLMALVPFGLSGSAAVLAVIVFNSIRAMAGNLGLPAWTSLSADIVPETVRGRYFGARSMVVTLAAIITVPLGGLLITQLGAPEGYQVDFVLAFLVGMAATWAYWQIQEPPSLEPVVVRGKRLPLMKRLQRRPNFVWFCIHTFLWNLGLHVAAPFFNVYLVTEAGGTSASVGYLTALVSFTSLPVQPFWGRLADRWGERRTILAASAIIPLLPIGWMFVTNPWHVVPINFISGLTWSGFNLATFNFLLGATPNNRRPRYVALYNIVVGIATSMGALLGGVIVDTLSYQAVFFTSGVIRALGWLTLLFFVRDLIPADTEPLPDEQLDT